jgi:hypothetical protein
MEDRLGWRRGGGHCCRDTSPARRDHYILVHLRVCPETARLGSARAFGRIRRRWRCDDRNTRPGGAPLRAPRQLELPRGLTLASAWSCRRLWASGLLEAGVVAGDLDPVCVHAMKCRERFLAGGT